MRTWLSQRWSGLVVLTTAVLVTTALVAGGAMAQTPPATATPTVPAKAPAATGTPTVPTKTPLERLVEKLAPKLGLGQDRVTAAVKETQKELIDEAVAANRITREAGDRLKERVDAGQFVLPHGGPKAGPGKGGPAGRGGPVMAGGPQIVRETAAFLTITPERVMTELRAGKSLAQIATDNGKTRQGLIDHLTAKAKERLDAAVAEGRITRERADQALARFTQGIGQVVDRTHTPGQGRPARPGQQGQPGLPGRRD
jgi:hypothetical protein